MKYNFRHQVITVKNGLFIVFFLTIIAIVKHWNSFNNTHLCKTINASLPPSIIRTDKEDIKFHQCPEKPPALSGRQNISRQKVHFRDLLKLFPNIHGGHIQPDDCQSKQKIAIIIPFRDRHTHLNIWLKNIIQVLYRQQRDVTIFVSEQAGNESFNRGMIKNIGFKEAVRYGNFDCFIFNDVDVIPEDDRNIYHCIAQPNHMSGRIDRHSYRHLYSQLVGGILAFQKNVFENINGYSNRFFVWGGEDDNLYTRIKANGFDAQRPLYEFSHCSTLRHGRDQKKNIRHLILKDVNLKVLENNDGLNSLHYKLVSIRDMGIYIHITAVINKTEIEHKLN